MASDSQPSTSGGHVNFFENLEKGETTSNTNQDREQEEKKEKEDYEKKIGLLTYLGQDSQELTGERSWWQKLPENRSEGNELPDSKQKLLDINDPMKDVRDYMGCKGMQRIAHEKKKKKRKRRRHSSSESSSDGDRNKRKKYKKEKRKKSHKHCDDDKQLKMQKLRKERLEREKREKARVDQLLYGKVSEPEKKSIDQMTNRELVDRQRKYNNQFNPELAKQNRLDANKKYWLE